MNPRPVQSGFVLVWVMVTVILLAAGLGAGQVLVAWFPARLFGSVRYSPWFAVSSLALWLGSLSLSRALKSVRRERQAQFRKWLHTVSACGVLFVACQSAALQFLFQSHNPQEVQVSDQAMAGVAASLHLLHFLVALFLLVYVTLQAHRGRYDHENTWGVTACVWVWNGMFGIWLAVLALIAISGQHISAPAATWDPAYQRAREF